MLQKAGNRYYKLNHGVIKLRRLTVDKIKLWNITKQHFKGDEKFIHLLLLDNYGTAVLKLSSVEGSKNLPNIAEETIELNKETLKFIRG